MLNIHYTLRNKLLHRFKLWGWALFFAKRRLSKNKDCFHAKKWLKICKDNYAKDPNHIGNIISSIFSNKTSEYTILLNTLKKNNFSPAHTQEILNSLNYSDKGMLLLLSIIGHLDIKDGDHAIEISYCRYLLYQYYYNEPVKAAFELRNHHDSKIQSEEHGTLFSVKECNLQEVEISSINKKISHGDTIIIVADTIEGLAEIITSLPDNININAYIMEECSRKSFSCVQSNISLKIYKFPQDILSLGSALEERAINVSEYISSEFIDLFLSHMKKIGKYNHIDAISSPLKLKMEDTILATLKKIMGSKYIAEQNNKIFVSLDKLERAKEILQYLFLINTKNTDRDLFFTRRKSSLQDCSQQDYVKKWFLNHLKPLLKTSLPINCNISLDTALYEYKAFHKALKKEQPYFKISNIISYLSTTSPNYLKASEILANKYKNIHEKMTIFSHCSQIHNIKKILESRKGIYQHDIIDVSKHKKIIKKYKNYTNWIDYVFNKAFLDSIQKKKIMVGDVDIALIMESKIKYYISSNIIYLMLMAETLSKAVVRSSPKYGIICPGRNYFSWLLVYILQANNIKVIDLQILFQSEYSRYKPSPADIFAMINKEQYNLYLKKFKIKCNQSISIVGSLLANDVIKKISSVNHSFIKKSIGIDESNKIILFATQYLNISECLSEIEAIFKIIKSYSDYCFIIKLHPKEPEENITMYENLVQKYQLQNYVTIVLNGYDTYDIIRISNLVITLFSNVGMEASLFKKYTWSINTIGSKYPCDITQDGIVVNINSLNKLNDYIYDFFNDAKHMTYWQQQQEIFFKENPETSDGLVFERIVNLMKD